jgi:hypothetical protein
MELLPRVVCVNETPKPSPSAVLRLILALAVGYFMISAWDDYLDELLREQLGLQRDTLSERLIRAVAATIIAIIVLGIANVHIDDLFGANINDISKSI